MSTVTDSRFVIPEITDTELTELASRIQPVCKCGPRGGLWFTEYPPDLRGTAYAWDPVKIREARGLVRLGTVRTLHTWAYYGFFKPTVAEVFAQLPREWRADARAFYCRGPRNADELNAERDALNAGFHVASTTFYTFKE